MQPDTQPAPLAVMGDGMDEFRVSSTGEIALLLRRLADDALPVHLSAPGGGACTAVLWTVDTARQRITLSADAGDTQLYRLIDAQEATAVSYLDSVKLQFDLHSLMLVHGHGSSALQADLPAEMFRFQRRQTFRVRMPSRTAPSAFFRHPAIPDMELALRVLDVSVGGCALFMPDDVPPLPLAVRIQGARLELDAGTRFTTTLQTHHVTSLNAETGGVRVGCSLLDLNGDAQRALQRCIDQTQKKRRLLSLD